MNAALQCRECKLPITPETFQKYDRHRCIPCRKLYEKARRKKPEVRLRNLASVQRYSKKERARILAIVAAIKNVPCLDCGGRFPACAMDFDHRPGEKKSFGIGLFNGSGSDAALYAEIAKCDIVCANCHRVRTYLRRRIEVETSHGGTADSDTNGDG